MVKPGHTGYGEAVVLGNLFVLAFCDKGSIYTIQVLEGEDHDWESEDPFTVREDQVWD